MQTLGQLCKPRSSVFDKSRRDTVLDLTDLIQGNIKPRGFFTENYMTDGMKRLLRESFRRFTGLSDQGIYVLSQAMGGGKTHNMIALGLLAQHPEIRQTVMGDLDQSENLGAVRVVAFTGRESDAPLGIWGAIAEQLGKKDVFNNYYSPLSAPGQSAWVNLLQGEPLLILLDELPPYLENAAAKTIGNSDLARVTTTAISNLLNAVNRDELSNVCVVVSDLKATYEGGSEQINRALENLKGEVGRGAVTLEPVGLNTDEVYHILRKRLFEELPGDDEIWEVARAYANSVKNAKQMDITNASPEKFAAQIKASYPFHFAIRDLYARFRENPGFQQTRGLIRLMRVVVARLFNDQGRADATYLIHAHDLDLNDSETKSEIGLINPTLDNAVSHDIASEGQAIAEIMDSNLSGTDAQDVCKLLLVSSLSNVPDGVRGLSLPEIVSFLCSPSRDVSRLFREVLNPLTTKAWYLHSNREGKLYFKNTQNLVAKLKTTAEGYNRQSNIKKLREFLQDSFTPQSMKDCYQEVLVFPAIDEIQSKIRQDRITLVICEPSSDGGLSEDLKAFWADLEYKNRILFLTGARNTLESLVETASELKAIETILNEMAAEKVPDNDPQLINAKELRDGILLRILSAMREAFTTLVYPTGQGLINADFLMQWMDNRYNGEKQIREALAAKQKFTEDIASDTFRKKCEARLFTQKVMPWSEVKKRSATNAQWQWHRLDALDALKENLVHQEQWREEGGGFVEKPPFPKPQTEIRWLEVSRNSDTGEVLLKLTPVNGDTIHYEIGGTATLESQTVADAKNFPTQEMMISFLCVDSKGEHEAGPPQTWYNRVTVKSLQYMQGSQKIAELQAAPAATILYTTDGSDPKLSGEPYEVPFAVPPGTVCVLAVAQKDAITSEPHRLDINWDTSTTVFEIEPDRPYLWKKRQQITTTRDAYEYAKRLSKFQAQALGPRITISGNQWIDLTMADNLKFTGEKLEDVINYLRGLTPEGEVEVDVESMYFETGQLLQDWVADVKTELTEHEVEPC